MIRPCRLYGERENGAQNTYTFQNPPYINLHGDSCGSCGQCREVASLETEIMRMQAALARNIERHHQLLGELNQSHSLINQHMPTEMMSSIFRFCLPEELEKKVISEDADIQVSVPFILGAVCQTWRNIAWSTPELWNQIYIPIDLEKISQQNEIAQQWLSRLGDLPLKICAVYVGTPDNWDYDSDGEHLHPIEHMIQMDLEKPIIDTINQYASRWADMYFFLPSVFLSQIQAESGAPHLRTVSLRPTAEYLGEYSIDMWKTREAEPRNVCLDLRVYPHPSHIDIYKLNWKSVTRLELLCLPTTLYIDILNQASNLTYFEMEDSDEVIEVDTSFVSIVHSNIRCFKYKSSQTESFIPPALLHLPALVEFHCDVNIENPAPLIDWFKSILENLSRLERLFWNTNLMGKDLIDVLEMAPSMVQHLYLTTSLINQTSLAYDSTFIDLSNYLSTTSLPEGSNLTQSTSFLPNLQSLTYVFRTEYIPWSHILDVFGSLHEINNALRRPLNSLKVLCSKDWHYDRRPPDRVPEIDMYVIPKLILLQRAGINLEIRHQQTDTDMLEAAIEKLDVNNSN